MRFSLDQSEKAGDFALDQRGESWVEDSLIGVDIADQLLAVTMLLTGSKGEEILPPVGVKHAIERSPFKTTARSIDGSQSSQAIERDFVGPDSNDGAVRLVEMVNCMHISRPPGVQGQSIPRGPVDPGTRDLVQPGILGTGQA